ncbi:MAG: hypothetical protein AAGK71_14130 [Pseudomonadota bacterium]
MRNIRVSSAVVITDLGVSHGHEARYVVTNEATGRHFSADARALQFLESLRADGSVQNAIRRSNTSPPHAARLVETFARNGLIAGADLDVAAADAKQPLEGKLISLRFDLANAARLARRLSWVGHLMFSVPMALVWGALVLLALAVFLNNSGQVTASLAQLARGGAISWVPAALLFVGLKAVHELGHIVAYRTMCLREGFDPGPIRVGMMIFAATPFPYTDVTSAWRISSRWRRAAIGAAGIYFETLSVAVLVLAWAALDLGALEPAILQVAVLSGALTLLFNLNPAVKLDGYYILTDLLRQPNLAGRASQAARAVVWRAFGAEAARPGSLELSYWLVSYAYRWTIFAGVFWIAYRFDPRLSALIAAAAATLLVIRPFFGTMKPILTKVTPMRIGATALVFGLLLVLAFVPFRARLVVDGQAFVYRTEFLRPSEPARVTVLDDGTRVVFAQPDVLVDRAALATRLEIVSNMARTRGLAAAELAALEGDRTSLQNRIAELDARIARLSPDIPDAAGMTLLSGERFDGQWVSIATDAAVAAATVPTKPFLELRIQQDRLEAEMSEDIQVRLTDQPDCTFPARPDRNWSDVVAREGVITIEAVPQDGFPPCATPIRNGAAIVARVPLPPRSIVERLRIEVRRLLQERLPFEEEV